jgi:hypothetical protein
VLARPVPGRHITIAARSRGRWHGATLPAWPVFSVYTAETGHGQADLAHRDSMASATRCGGGRGTELAVRTKDLARRTLDDIQHGRHREAYALFLIGVVLAVLGLAGVADIPVLLSTILLALSFLVFHTAVDASDQRPALDQVLCDRQSFGAFSQLLPGVRDLRIYGPTAVNVLVNAADIRRFVLQCGGTVRVIVHDDDSALLEKTALQLDDNMELESTLHNSLATLGRLATVPGFSYRKLPVNPGFSLVIVNPDDARGYVIFESQGFKDENIADRMHITIKRHESPHWFAYWVARFDAMWETAQLASQQAEPPRT